MKTKNIKIAAVSDTHCLDFKINQKEADIWIFAGDYTDGSGYDMFRQVSSFWIFLDNLERSLKENKPKLIIITWGNHDAFAMYDAKNPLLMRKLQGIEEEFGVKIEVLVNDIIEFEGIKIYGAPYSTSALKKETRPFSWTNKTEKQVSQVLKKATPDIIVTHSPPEGILDTNLQNENVGDWHWNEYLNGHKPQLWVFGHIHNSHGTFKDSTTDYYNVAYKKEHSLGEQEPNGITYIEKEFIVKDKSYTAEVKKET